MLQSKPIARVGMTMRMVQIPMAFDGMGHMNKL